MTATDNHERHVADARRLDRMMFSHRLNQIGTELRLLGADAHDDDTRVAVVGIGVAVQFLADWIRGYETAEEVLAEMK